MNWTAFFTVSLGLSAILLTVALVIAVGSWVERRYGTVKSLIAAAFLVVLIVSLFAGVTTK